MALSDINQIDTTSLNTSTTDYVAGDEPWNKNIDGYIIEEQGTEIGNYQCDWEKWHGLYRTVPELRSTIDLESKWIIGRELKCDEKTKKIIERISGNGKHTFRQILMNVVRVSKIAGDCYAEQVRDKAGRLINLKVLDHGSIVVVSDEYGMIKSYKQVLEKGSDVIKQKKKILNIFPSSKIFHISNESIADEIHGIPEIEKLMKLIKIRHQGIDDYAVILHRYGKPTYFYEAGTDDETELNSIRTVLNNAVRNFENVVTPKGALNKIERVAVPQYSTIDPLPWLNHLRSYFTESSNVPDLIRGKSEEVSLAAGKLNYLGFKEKIIMEQLEFSEQIEAQLGLKISFEEPREIDIEISRSQEEMDLRSKAKKQKGGQLQAEKTIADKN